MARTKNTDSLGVGGGGIDAAPRNPFAGRISGSSVPDNRASLPGDVQAHISASDTGGEGGNGSGGGSGRTGQTIRAPQSSKAGGLDLRQVFTGATLKKIIGLPSVLSEVLMGKVKSLNGGLTSTVANDKSDVYVSYVDVISGIPGIGRLFSPGNAFWRLPKANDSIMVLKPSEADGPGIPYVLHGDGGGSKTVPTFLGSNDSGTFVVENWHMEAGGFIRIKSSSGAGGSGNDSATTATIDLKADGTISISGGIGVNIDLSANGGGNVVINGGVLRIARVSDQVQGTAGPYPIMNGLISGPGATNALA